MNPTDHSATARMDAFFKDVPNSYVIRAIDHLLQERKRQIAIGFDPQHDDKHTKREWQDIIARLDRDLRTGAITRSGNVSHSLWMENLIQLTTTGLACIESMVRREQDADRPMDFVGADTASPMPSTPLTVSGPEMGNYADAPTPFSGSDGDSPYYSWHDVRIEWVKNHDGRSRPLVAAVIQWHFGMDGREGHQGEPLLTIGCGMYNDYVDIFLKGYEINMLMRDAQVQDIHELKGMPVFIGYNWKTKQWDFLGPMAI